MSTKSDQVYRQVEPSDLPKIQQGTLKAFYNNDLRESAELISTRVKGIEPTMWLIKCSTFDSWHFGLENIIVDVTPEKRYAIWNHKMQRFCNNAEYPSATGFLSKGEAEVFMKKRSFDPKYFYVVEWEIKKDD